jgi:hypothetical protein
MEVFDGWCDTWIAGNDGFGGMRVFIFGWGFGTGYRYGFGICD